MGNFCDKILLKKELAFLKKHAYDSVTLPTKRF